MYLNDASAASCFAFVVGVPRLHAQSAPQLCRPLTPRLHIHYVRKLLAKYCDLSYSVDERVPIYGGACILLVVFYLTATLVSGWLTSMVSLVTDGRGQE